MIPKARSTGISPAKYLIACKEKASAKVMPSSAKKVKFDVPLEEKKSDSQSQSGNGLNRKILVSVNQHRLAFSYQQPRQLVLIETVRISN